MTSAPTRLPVAETAGARVMANAWTEYLAALWRGDPSASAFAEWLASFWEPVLHRPAGDVDARSSFALAGGAIDWYERDGWVSGHVPGQMGGYLLPRSTILAYPWVGLAKTAA